LSRSHIDADWVIDYSLISSEGLWNFRQRIASGRNPMSHSALLTIAYTPDSDDAFYYYALETGRVPMPGFLPEFRREHMGTLNAAAQKGSYDVTAISSVVYPMIADRYAILDVGTSVGRGYGPVLVSRNIRKLYHLRGRHVGVAGIPTTGWFLLRWLCPEAIPVAMPFDQIADAVARGDLAAGVMIHEELLYYPKLGLRQVVDLGAEWCRQSGLPLPVGLNVARRDLGKAGMEDICSSIRASLEYGLANRQETIEWVSRFGRGKNGKCTDQFVKMFANTDSLHLAADVRQALKVLLQSVVDLGFGTAVPALDIVGGTECTTSTRPVGPVMHREITNG
jgi:1,4-dihydroxy-6-naphthoate synthase